MELQPVHKILCSNCARWWPVPAFIFNSVTHNTLEVCPACTMFTPVRTDTCRNCGGMIERPVGAAAACFICACNAGRNAWHEDIFNMQVLARWQQTRRFMTGQNFDEPIPPGTRVCRCNRCGGRAPQRRR